MTLKLGCVLDGFEGRPYKPLHGVRLSNTLSQQIQTTLNKKNRIMHDTLDQLFQELSGLTFDHSKEYLTRNAIADMIYDHPELTKPALALLMRNLAEITRNTITRHGQITLRSTAIGPTSFRLFVGLQWDDMEILNNWIDVDLT